MTDMPRPSHAAGGADSGQPVPAEVHTRPRWVNVSAVIAVALVLAFVVVHLVGGGMGNHG
jgi:hypothetical protein